MSQLLFWYYVCADLTVTSDKLKELFQPVDLNEIHIDIIVRCLYLPMSEVDKINENYHNPTHRKNAYFDLYVHQHPCPSWGNVATLLRFMNLNQQVDLVENTYVKGM